MIRRHFLQGIKIQLEYKKSIVVNADSLLLEQALVNLINNAIKYSKENSNILVSANDLDNEIILKVKDEGIGIPESHLTRIFERFYRVDKARSRKQGGTGLGLAIVKHIVHSHNGEVAVKSTPGEGSTFSIKLPGNLP